MRKILIFLFFLSSVFANNLHITSKTFKFNSGKMQGIFTGDVNATENKNNILSEKMVIFFDKNKKPIKYIATKNVKFILNLDKNATYKGHCEKLVYFFKNEDIYLFGNALVKKLQTGELISGEEIKINRKTKDISVVGGKKPINIIIKVNNQ